MEALQSEGPRGVAQPSAPAVGPLMKRPGRGGLALAIVTGAGALLLVLMFGAERLAEWSARRALKPPGVLVALPGPAEGGGEHARRLHFECVGEGSPTVLFESSGPGTARQYEAVLSAIGRDAKACAYDRAGMGFSDPAPGGRSAQDLLDDLTAGLRAAHLSPPYVLVASSFGGLVAELFAREHPDDVAGLVLLDALTTETVDDHHLATLASAACAVRWAGELGLLRLADPFGLARTDPIGFQLTSRAMTWRTVCRTLRDLPATARELRAAPPLRADLPVTVVVHGEPRGLIPAASAAQNRAVDATWLAAQHAVARRSTRARFVVADGSGHLIVEERPELVIDEVRSMLSHVRAQR